MPQRPIQIAISKDLQQKIKRLKKELSYDQFLSKLIKEYKL